MAWDDDLDPQSATYRIAASDAARLRVIAGPGTGKSFAMKRRVARLLEAGAQPSQILAITFTRVAAEDLHRELVALDVPGCENLKGRTLHSLALSVLYRNHVLNAVGRTPRPMNKFEERALVCDLAAKYGGKNRVKTLIKGYVAAWARTQGETPGFAPGSREHSFSIDAQNWLRFHCGMLIGEVVPYLLYYLHNNPASAERTEFRHILVDEYQDLNQAEQDIVRLMSDAANVMIVGDDDQSLYSFKFSHPEGIRQWLDANPGADDLSLLECHRCPTRIVDMANSLISYNRERTCRRLTAIPANGPGEIEIRQFRNLAQEAIWIANKVAEIIASGQPPGDIIVLAQRRVIANQIKAQLGARGIACVSFYDESPLEALDAQERLALLKLYIDNEDRAALRFLLGANHPNMRARPYARIRDYCDANGSSPWAVLVALQTGRITIPHVAELVDRFQVIQDDLRLLGQQSATLENLVDNLFPDGVEALRDLREVATAELGTVTTPQDLLVEMLETITQPEIPPTVHEVRLMSLHKSKGLSSPYVFVAGCVQGLLPSVPNQVGAAQERNAELEEQRRLFYVAITRVKADVANHRPGSLFITYSMRMPMALAHQARISPARQSYNEAHLQASTFLSELGPSAPVPIAG